MGGAASTLDNVDPSTSFHRRTVRHVVRRGLRNARSLLGNHPVFLPIVLRATPRGTSRRITARTQVVVEGFPRSGNTFAAAALRHVGGGGLVIASHVHTPSQVVLATRRGIPTLVVVRRPVDSVASLLIAAPHVHFDRALEEWTDHYRRMWALRDALVVATFDQVTDDFGSVLDRLNSRFGLELPGFAHEPDELAAVMSIMAADHQRYHEGDERSAPWPVERRDATRAWIVDQLNSASYASLVADANEWFERLDELAR
jgi:hypothetical protein